MKGSIKEKEIDFVLDTGAEITVIPTKLAQGLNIPYKKTKLCLTGVIGEDSVLYEELHLKAFNDLKRALCQAPALGIAQSDRPFVLYVHEHLGL